MRIGNYLNDLGRISSRVMKIVHLGAFFINPKQLKRVFGIFKNVEEIRLWKCKFDLSVVPDMSKALEKCKIEKICLSLDTNNKENEKSKKVKIYDYIVNTLAQSEDLRKSLQTFRIFHAKLSKEVLIEIFDNYALGHVLSL